MAVYPPDDEKTMRTKAEIEKQILEAYRALEIIQKNDRITFMGRKSSGCHWREQRRYIDALEWVLNDEGS